MAEEGRSSEREDEGDERLLDGMAVLDFDMLCATVASRTQRFSVESRDKEGDEVGGVQRMWEGGAFDCFEDRWIAIEAACCPCYRFGRNMERANLGSCFLQGTVYAVLVVAALSNFILFGITRHLCYVYIGAAFIIVGGIYLGYFRTRLRKLFNIRSTSGNFDDCMHHLICSCCSLCQEARTLEMNNVQSGVWHGRGDTICIGSFGEGSKSFTPFNQPQIQLIKSLDPNTMERDSTAHDHKWSAVSGQGEPLISAATQESPI